MAFNTLRPRQNGRHFPDEISRCISFNKSLWISIKMSQKFVLNGSINNIPALVQIMAPTRRQAVIWTSDGYIYALLGLNELMDWRPWAVGHQQQWYRPAFVLFCFVLFCFIFRGWGGVGDCGLFACFRKYSNLTTRKFELISLCGSMSTHVSFCIQAGTSITNMGQL